MPPDLAPLGLSDSVEEWPVVESEDVFRAGLPFALRMDTLHHPDDSPDDGGNKTFRRLVLEHPGASAVLALDDEDRVLVIRQYRHAAGRRFVELPAGLIDQEGEDPEQVGRRELVEEVGYQAASWTHLGSTWSSPGITAEVIHLFLARDLSPADRGDFVLQHEEADMQVLWMPYADLLAGVLAGRIADAPLVNAVLLAQARGLVGGEREG